MASAIRCRWLLDRLPFRNEVQFWIEGNGTSGPNRELETRWKDLWCMMRVADSTSGKPLALDDVQSKPWTFSIKRNRAEYGVLSKVQTNKRWYYQFLIAGRPNWGQTCRPTYE